jgi:hypothetical protein
MCCCWSLWLFFVIIKHMKTPPKSSAAHLPTPLASGETFASTSAEDVLLLLQQQAALLASQEQLNRSLQEQNKRLQALEAENKQLKLALAHHGRMRFGIKSEVFNDQQRDLFAEDWQVDDADLQQHVAQLGSSQKTEKIVR